MWISKQHLRETAENMRELGKFGCAAPEEVESQKGVCEGQQQGMWKVTRSLLGRTKTYTEDLIKISFHQDRTLHVG